MQNRIVTFDSEPKGIIEKIKTRYHANRGYISQKQRETINSFIVFIGHQRSGHSLIGILLDAHDSCCISHELDIAYYVQNGYSKREIFNLIGHKSQSFKTGGSNWQGYSYEMGGSKPLESKNLSHIGDKCGGRMSKRLFIAKDFELLRKVERKVGCDLKILHVIRNPFDNISTMAKRLNARNKLELGMAIEKATKRYSRFARLIDQCKESGQFQIYSFHYEKFILDFENEMSKLLDFLNLEETTDYIQRCKKLIWNEVRESRHKYADLWTSDRQDEVRKLISEIEFLNLYKESKIIAS